MARERVSVDRGWRFHLGDAADPYSDFRFGAQNYTKAGEAIAVTRADVEDSAWRPVDAPHDWAVELPFDRDMPNNYSSTGSKPLGRLRPGTTIGWYRRSLDIAATDEGRRIWIEFDGVFRDCIVWLNGHLVGRNLSGYTPFRFDLTDILNYGGRNAITVRVDASEPEGWFYEGAGIYRHVWLTKADPVHVAPATLFVPYEVKKETAGLAPELELVNDSDAAVDCQVRWQVTDPKGRVVASARSAAALTPWSRQTVRTEIAVRRPALWDLDSPKLYTVVAAVHRGRKETDRVETAFGIRTTRWDPDQGFFLNDRPVKLKGVCCHQDHAGVGAAVPDALQTYRVRLLREMGCNAYRSAHNPPTPELLDACDRLGMLVMDETRQCGSGVEQLAQLDALVRRDRNHPSVILWSIGNEEHTIQASPVGKRVARTMGRLVRKLDPTRPVTAALNNGGKEGGFVGEIDVHGWNYIRIGKIDEWHAAHPRTPLVGSEEASHLATRGIYEERAQRAHTSAYCTHRMGWTSSAEEWWKFYLDRPWLAGGFVWTGFDYRGEPSPFRWPGISSHFGIMDLCGFPKDNYWYYRAWWTDEPILHLMPHWNWPGRDGQSIDVWCYSNGDEVELLLNGRSLGKQSMPKAGRLEWKVNYEPGTLLARSCRGGKRMLERKVETTGVPASLVLAPDRKQIAADGADVVVFNVTVVDSAGRVVPTADNLVTFGVKGGTVLGVGNGDPGSHEPDKADRRKAFSGRCQVIVQAPSRAGSISIAASAEGLKPARVAIRAL